MPKHPTRKYTVHPDDADLKQAADLINSAKQPLFLGGSGVGFSCCGLALDTTRGPWHSLEAFRAYRRFAFDAGSKAAVVNPA